MNTKKQRFAKGEQTKKRILDTALDLFVRNGYDQTTIRDIAAETGCSLGLTYRYFAAKEDLVFALYYRISEEMEKEAQTLKPGKLADRFQEAMEIKLRLIAPYRDLLGALFGSSMNPNSRIGVLSRETTDLRQRSENVFAKVVDEAKNKPTAVVAGQMPTILNGIHLALLLYWLHDRSPEQKATRDLIGTVRKVLSLITPLISLPMARQAVIKLGEAMRPVIGGKNGNSSFSTSQGESS